MTLASSPVRLPDSELRIGDAERQEAAAQLQDHFAAGRLSWVELDERLGQAWAARTRGELAVLFTDLPLALIAPAPEPRRRFRMRFDPRLLVAAVLFASLVFWTRGFILVPVLAFVLIRGHRRGRGRYAGGPYPHQHQSHHETHHHGHHHSRRR